jgi:hypothetical protein
MWLTIALLLLLVRPVMAQPADCVTALATGSVVPLAIELAGRPGVPKGVRGQAYIDVPMRAPAGAACHDDPPPPPRDVLHGAPGDVLAGAPGEVPDGTAANVPPTGVPPADVPPSGVVPSGVAPARVAPARIAPARVLSGPPSPDLLRGPEHPHVKIEVR